jgi:hypothetical protein
LARGAALAHAMTRHTHHPLKIFGFALGASEFDLLFRVSQKELEAIIAFQTPEFINRHIGISFTTCDVA